MSALVRSASLTRFADVAASRYLKEGARTLAEISSLIGFSEPSAFSRWHRTQFGVAARTRVRRSLSMLASGR
jgi:transcriptional regulator GlxA family with amidase domain